MRPVVLKLDGRENAQKIERAGRVVREGGLVGFPTETVYGLGANAHDAEAVRRLRKVKRRPEGKPFSVLIAHRERAYRLAGSVPRAGEKLMRVYWPGPLTLVLPARGGGFIGLRLPAREEARALARAASTDIAAPSANRSGGREPRSADDVLEELGPEIDLVLDGGEVKGVPSTVVRIGEGGEVARGELSQVEVLREGAVPKEELLDAARYRVLMVCSGNSCRSPMAEALFKKELTDGGKAEIAVSSAAVGSLGEGGPSREAVEVMREVGLDISGHEARPLTVGELDRADLVFVMQEKHRRSIVDLLPDAEERVRLIAEGGISDPAGKGLDEYRRVRRALARGIRELVRTLPCE